MKESAMVKMYRLKAEQKIPEQRDHAFYVPKPSKCRDHNGTEYEFEDAPAPWFYSLIAAVICGTIATGIVMTVVWWFAK